MSKNNNSNTGKSFWVMALAIALGVSINSCQNQKILEEAKKKQLPNANDINLSELLEPAKIDLDKYKLDNIKTVEDYLREMEEENNQVDDNNYQKIR